jgi:hypothetical protein
VKPIYDDRVFGDAAAPSEPAAAASTARVDAYTRLVASLSNLGATSAAAADHTAKRAALEHLAARITF